MVTEFKELFILPLGVGDTILPISRGLSPFTNGCFSCIEPSDVCIFLLAGGKPCAPGCGPGWVFFDLNKNAMVYDFLRKLPFLRYVCGSIAITKSNDFWNEYI